MRTRVRRNEVFGRWGGEEFALLLPETVREGALHLAEEIRQLVCAQPFVFDSYSVSVTVSLGVAQWHPGLRTVEEFVKAADDLLYAAKHAGRNRVMG